MVYHMPMDRPSLLLPPLVGSAGGAVVVDTEALSVPCVIGAATPAAPEIRSVPERVLLKIMQVR